MSLIFCIHLLSCLFMTGVIWLIQLVHYPSFAYVQPQHFHSFNQFHQTTISIIVAPAMILELLTAIGLTIFYPTTSLNYILLSLLTLTWLSTFALSLPLHSKLLSNGYNKKVIRRLILTNWPRTFLWSLRSVILLYLLVNIIEKNSLFL